MKRGKAVATQQDGKWVIWKGDNPVAIGSTNAEAWFDYEGGGSAHE